MIFSYNSTIILNNQLESYDPFYKEFKGQYMDIHNFIAGYELAQKQGFIRAAINYTRRIPQVNNNSLLNKSLKAAEIIKMCDIENITNANLNISCLSISHGSFNAIEACKAIIKTYEIKDSEEFRNVLTMRVLLAHRTKHKESYNMYLGQVVILESYAFFVPDYNYKDNSYTSLKTFQVSTKPLELFNNDIWYPYFSDSKELPIIPKGSLFDKALRNNLGKKKPLLKEKK